MDYEFNEFHFVGTHMDTVNKVLLKPNQASALKLLHLNKFVLKQISPKLEEEDAPPAPDQPSTSTMPPPQVKGPKKGTQKRKKSKSTTPVKQDPEQPLTPTIPPVEIEARNMVTIGTQTTLEVVPVDPPAEKEEEVFNTFHLKSMRQQYLVTTKRTQDFGDETDEEEVLQEREKQKEEGKRVFKKSKIFKDPYQ